MSDKKNKIGLTPDKIKLLNKLVAAKNNISRKQRKDIYLPLSSILSKATFNQMVTGVYVSNANIETAKLILDKMLRLHKENGLAMKSLS
jgi:hypothetical protein